MNLHRAVPLLLPLLFTGIQPLGASKVPDAEAFRAYAPIEGHFVPQELFRLPMEPWVFQHSLHFPNDLRIVDAEDEVWPFFLHIPVAAHEQWQEASIRNLRWVEQPPLGSWLVFDLHLPNSDSETTLHDALELHTTGSFYLRRVEILGGQAAEKGMLGRGYLMAEGESTNRTLVYPPSNFQTLEIRIHASVRSTDDTFELKSARVRLHNPKTASLPQQRIDFVELPVAQSDKPAGEQAWELDLRQDQRMPESLLVEVGDSSFFRPVTLYGRRTQEEPWSWICAGALHRHSSSENLRLQIPPTHRSYRYLKLAEQHFDDAPLQVNEITLSATQAWLVVEARSTLSAQLRVGHPDLHRVQYDLSRRIEGTDLDSLKLVALSSTDLRTTVESRPRFLERYDSWIGAAMVGLFSLLILGTILRMSKRLPPPQAGE